MKLLRNLPIHALYTLGILSSSNRLGDISEKISCTFVLRQDSPKKVKDIAHCPHLLLCSIFEYFQLRQEFDFSLLRGSRISVMTTSNNGTNALNRFANKGQRHISHRRGTPLYQSLDLLVPTKRSTAPKPSDNF